MATAAEPSASASSSSSTPQLRRESRHASSPWSRVVRGEPEAAPSNPTAPLSPSPPLHPAAPILPPELSDRSPPPFAAAAASDDQAAGGPSDAAVLPLASDRADQGGGGGDAAASRGKKAAWSKPSNGVIEGGPVMGAVAWPALSEAAKGSPRSSPSDSAKSLSDGSASAAPEPAITSSPPKQISKNSSFSSSASHGSPTRQKSMKRGGNTGSGSPIPGNSGGTLANGGPPPPSLVASSAEVPEDASDKPVASQPSSSKNSGNWDHGSRGGGGPPQSHGGNEQHRGYGGNRRGNSSGGGGALYHNNFASRRGPERSGYDWNNRFSGGRDLQMQQQQQPRAMARPFLRPIPPGSAPFMSPPPPVRPYASPVGYYDIPSPVFYVPPPPPPESHGGMPFIGPPAMYYAVPDSQLRATLAKQIDYYFSPENLCKDIYLRQNMDEEGWVPISLIASFNRVRNLTNNFQFILETVRTSQVVEVQGDKIRRRNDWMNWPPLTAAPNPPHSSAILSYESLATHVRSVKLEEGNTSQNSMRGVSSSEVILTRSSSELGQSKGMIASNGERSGQSASLPSSNQSMPIRSFGRSETF